MGIEITDLFRKLGLSDYESRALSTLLGRHDAAAEYISDTAEVPITKVYGVLNSLEKRGLIKASLERPKKYKPVDPRNVLGIIIKKRDEETKALKQLAMGEMKDLCKRYEFGENYKEAGKLKCLPEELMWDNAAEFMRKSAGYEVCLDEQMWKTALASDKLAKIMGKKTVKSRIIIPSSLDLAKQEMRLEWVEHLCEGSASIRVIDESKITANIIIAADCRACFLFKNLLTSKPMFGITIDDKMIAAGASNYFNHLWNHSTSIEKTMKSKTQKLLMISRDKFAVAARAAICA